MPILSPLMLAGAVRASQQFSVRHQGRGDKMYIGTKAECEAFRETLPADVKAWVKVI